MDLNTAKTAFSNISDRQKCEEEIHRIARILRKQHDVISDSSLFSGKTTQALFFSYYSKMFNDIEAKNYVETLLGEIVDDIVHKPLNFTLVNGIAGVHWGLQTINHLFEKEFFEVDFFDDIQTLLEEFILNKLTAKNYDLFYGALGGYISLKQSSHNNKKFDEEVTQLLLDISTYSSNGRYWWIDSLSKNGENVLNLGLAHGLPSLWYFLGTLYQRTSNSHLCKVLSTSIATYKEFSLTNSNSQFPIEIFLSKDFKEIEADNRRSSKLSWCYGDFCIAEGLIRASKILNDNHLYTEGVNIALKSIERDTLQKAGLFDPCLCHGTTSCMHFYNKFFRETGLSQFAAASTRWFNLGLNYKTDYGYQLLEESEVQIFPHSLLDGITGIGLAYMSMVSKRRLGWDKILLLN